MHKNFIQTHFLKNNEVIEKITKEHSLHVMTVTKKTARTYRKTAQFKVTTRQVIAAATIPEQLKKYKFTPNVKRTLHESNEVIQQWLQDGWVVREIRYNDDGISVKEEHYRIGPLFIETLQQQQQSSEQQIQTDLTKLQQKAKQLQLPSNFQQAIDMDKLPQKWTLKRKLKYIEFCIALYELSQQKDLFDFKEIGATLFDTIGGSKYFDAEREIFTKQLEKSGIDASFYGLVSFGKIVPIFFTGNVENEFATYKAGVVHATTDNAVLQAPFTTTNKVLWLVENRAILTRMAMEQQFLQQTNSCIVCLDGQIRSAHRLFIEQLLQSGIEQTIIWTDTDAAGVTIAKHAVTLIANRPLKIIGHQFKIYDCIETFAKEHVEQVHEQEQQLGGVEQWMKVL